MEALVSPVHAKQRLRGVCVCASVCVCVSVSRWKMENISFT